MAGKPLPRAIDVKLMAFTRNPQPATRNSPLATRNPQPALTTRNPQLTTRNAQLAPRLNFQIFGSYIRPFLKFRFGTCEAKMGFAHQINPVCQRHGHFKIVFDQKN